MNRNVESLHEGKKLLSKKGNEGKKPSILHTISFTTPGTFCMFFFQRLSLLKVHLHKYKKNPL